LTKKSGRCERGYATAKSILSENRETLVRIAKALIEREVLDASEIKLLVDGQDLPPIKPLPAKTTMACSSD